MSDVKKIIKRLGLPGAYLAGANLAGANLPGASLDRAYLPEASLDRANLAGANLRGANLEGACLEGARLAGASLGDANLKGANMHGSDLRGADLTGTRIKHTHGNQREIRNIELDSDEFYRVIYTSTNLQIGCKNRTFQKWSDFDEYDIRQLDGGMAVRFWKKYKSYISSYIEQRPATSHLGDPKYKS